MAPRGCLGTASRLGHGPRSIQRHPRRSGFRPARWDRRRPVAAHGHLWPGRVADLRGGGAGGGSSRRSGAVRISSSCGARRSVRMLVHAAREPVALGARPLGRDRTPGPGRVARCSRLDVRPWRLRACGSRLPGTGSAHRRRRVCRPTCPPGTRSPALGCTGHPRCGHRAPHRGCYRGAPRLSRSGVSRRLPWPRFWRRRAARPIR